uniref:Uncharacterized protein n=1 Tax=Chromera velia CCMP2878 TaxID=1169474 RepID=A0A0G4GET6_9ALVE|eukprot:Cvel_21552.t1-p1 / transcript=Cvel_21552.t1 / gene=Cvel_21552 / organism=Chromera_velia_CCMP2878 / gene_product=hypothetical protein / transcript_product=hypothetical protein / location=Cvel_scaffold2032:13035-13706(+) / protein_length=224 / sequence_SO=supercontig / SO=protein_coding / is_pseudo=false
MLKACLLLLAVLPSLYAYGGPGFVGPRPGHPCPRPELCIPGHHRIYHGLPRPGGPGRPRPRPFPLWRRRLGESVPDVGIVTPEDTPLPQTEPLTPPTENAVSSDEMGVVTPEEEEDDYDKQNFGFVNGPWFDQRRQNYFNGGFNQNFNTWNGNNYGNIGTVFGGYNGYGYYGRRLQDVDPSLDTVPSPEATGEVEEEEEGLSETDKGILLSRDVPEGEKGIRLG